MVQGSGGLGLVLHGSCYWALGEARTHVRVWSPAPSQSYPENPMQHQRQPPPYLTKPTDQKQAQAHLGIKNLALRSLLVKFPRSKFCLTGQL
jgi:hypothetical protein